MNARETLKEQRVIVPIVGLGCGGGGALDVEHAIAKVRGVAQVYVNPATETAYVRFDPNACELARIIAAIEASGFRAGHVRP